MAEYIERENVYEMLHAIGGCGAEPRSWADGWDKAIDTAIDELSEIPAADVRPERHGHWVAKEFSERGYSKHYTYTNYFCSECGRRLKGYSSLSDAPYCHCGAKMDGEGED